jgi:hypothetical protein
MSKDKPPTPPFEEMFKHLPEDIRQHCAGCMQISMGYEDWDGDGHFLLSAQCEKFDVWWNERSGVVGGSLNALRGFLCDEPELDAKLLLKKKV